MKKNLPLLLFSLLISGLQAQYDHSNIEEGIAVFYSDDLHGQATSYGEEYRREGFTAAHQFYPLGTIVRVTRLDNGRSVEVRINDKMSPDNERKIILSRAAALQLDLLRFGKARVRIERISEGSFNPYYTTGGGRNNAGGSGQLTTRSPYSGSYGYSGGGTQPQGYDYSPSNTANTYQGTSYGSPANPYEPPATAYNSGTAARAPAGAVQGIGQALPAQSFGYAIQLASYQEVGNAVSNVNELRQRGLQDAYVWQKDGKNRVVIASFPDKESAMRYLYGLRQQHLLDGIVVKIQ